MPTMTTIVETLLARAQQYEEKATALRVAAAEMNGHALDAKVTALPATLKAATKLRKQQRPAEESAPPALVEAATKGDIEPLILNFVDGAARQVGAIRRHLADHGVHVSEYRVRHFVHKHPLITRQGTGSNTVWQLQMPGPSPSPALSPHATLKAHRAAKVEQILDILKSHGAPMRVRELAAAARERGIKSLTGIVGLVRMGKLATRGSGAKRTYRLA